uniref:glycosyltransferase 1 domain-containing protein 1-like n=1 Tax=Styela clava TaxID=7725 RepID=UPI001939EDC1|nr:glycosyltransferase 1 domain-containing protein 1-like [Styela clava]
MKILIISPTSISSVSGNACTVQRIQKHLASSNSVCITCSVDVIISQNAKCTRVQLKNFVAKNGIDCILFLHAYKSAKILLCSCEKCSKHPLSVPYGIIFGGTDLNADILDEEKCLDVKEILLNAKFAVAFTEDLRRTASQLVPQLNIFVQPQAVELVNVEPKALHNVDFNSNMFTDNGNHNLYGFLMVTGIRPVKDPIFLLEAWMKWCKNNQHLNLKLLIIGPVIDLEYADSFFNLLASLKDNWTQNDFTAKQSTQFKAKSLDDIFDWFGEPDSFPILYSSALPREELKILMHSSFIFASINSSYSEGMASAVLESMANKIPVIARDNSGNRSLVEDNKTGLLYQTCEDFMKQTEKLIENPGLRSLIIENAFQMVQNEHSIEKEKEFYSNLCQDFFAK